MNDPRHQEPDSIPAHVVYPCGPHVQWVLYMDHLAVMRSDPKAQSFSIDLNDLYGIDYKEPGLGSGSAQIRPVDHVFETFEDESVLIFSLDAKYKQQRQVFLQTLVAHVPHVVIQPVDVSPEKELRRRINTARARASIAAREKQKADRRAEQKAQQEAATAAAVKKSFMRADGTVALEPVGIIGPVLGRHIRLYTDAIVEVDGKGPYQYSTEILHNPTEVSEIQWGFTERGQGFVRLEPQGQLVHLDISKDPTAALCSQEELTVALQQFEQLYPALSVRRIAVLGDELNKVMALTVGQSTEKKVRTALTFIPRFSAGRHLISAGGGRAIALDPVQQKFCVIDLRTWVCRIYMPSNLLSVEVYEDSRVQVSHRRDGRDARALATTGLLVGDVVSLTAGLAANKASKPKEHLTELTLRIALDDPDLPICDMRLSGGAVKLSGGAHQSMSAVARTWASLLSALIRSSEQNASAHSPGSTLPAQSVVSELAQLADLFAAGHLTAEEFAELKARLIGR